MSTPRYVITHIDHLGSRLITHLDRYGSRRTTFAHEVCTHGSRDGANKMLRAKRGELQHVLAADEFATLEVRAVACHDHGDHDPVSRYCDRFSVESGNILRDGVPFMGIDSEAFRESEYGHSHVEIDALRHWFCAKLNSITSEEIAEILREYKES